MRGFNQAELLCREMPSEKLSLALMLRVRKTRPQAELNANQRRTNLLDAFVASSEVAGKSVLLVDDVVTTGGTGIACASALKKAGAQEVGLLAFCGESSHFRTE